MTKIYKVVSYDCQIRFNFFVTKKEAVTFQQQFLKENKDKDFSCEIDVMDVKLTRRGIVEELNWLITATCFNEN